MAASKKSFLTVVPRNLALAALIAFCTSAAMAKGLDTGNFVSLYEPAYGVTYPIPAHWSTTSEGLIARHRGFDPILISSFAIPEGYNYEWGPPPGEVMFHIAFDGNDFRSSDNLFAYVWDNIASREYMPTGKEIRLGGKTFVELRGELGTLWVTHHGANVYSVFIYGGEAQTQNRTLRKVVANLHFDAADPIYIAPEDRGLKGGGVPAKIEYAPVLFTKAAPSMKLPWAAGSYVLTGGPHGGALAWDCLALRSTSEQDGLDFGLPNNTEVLAVAAGTVRYVGNPGDGRGNMVTVEHVGYGFASQYWHLSSTSVTNGTAVVQGKVLGRSGNSGTTAYHLHLEFRNYPSDTSYSAHGIVIDGYTAWTYIRNSDNKGWNYQGTMTKGTVTAAPFTYCSTPATKRTGSTSTATAGSGSVTSTNVRVP
jgi:Peptidase family M23